jgi:undecaprenyl-phosphate 4-deoxy-4-formamido-L-arabinose transferase
MEVSVVVPVFNSQYTVGKLYRSLDEVLNLNFQSYEIILVNDASTDGVAEAMNNLPDVDSLVRIHNEQNLGQLESTRRGILVSQGDFIVTIDDDLEYYPAEIIMLYEKIIAKQADVVFGISPDKYKIQGKWEVFAKFRNKLMDFVFNKPKTDSFKIIRRSFLANEAGEIQLDSHFESYLRRRKSVAKLAYVDVSFRPRDEGDSNYGLRKKLIFLYRLIKGYFKK